MITYPSSAFLPCSFNFFMSGFPISTESGNWSESTTFSPGKSSRLSRVLSLTHFSKLRFPGVGRRASPHPRADGERDLDNFVKRRFMPDRAKDASVFGLFYGLKRRAGIENAAASGTKDVPRHIETAESRAVKKSRQHIILIEPVPGGKGESIDAAKLAVRRVVDELFD